MKPYRFQKEVKGLEVIGIIQPKNLVVRGTSDTKGKTLSISDDNGGIMLTIPLEPILEELKQMIK